MWTHVAPRYTRTPKMTPSQHRSLSSHVLLHSALQLTLLLLVDGRRLVRLTVEQPRLDDGAPGTVEDATGYQQQHHPEPVGGDGQQHGAADQNDEVLGVPAVGEGGVWLWNRV